MSHEKVGSPESPNQPFHDLLRQFGRAIIANLQQANGITGYPSEVLRDYEQKLDQLLAERDQARKGTSP